MFDCPFVGFQENRICQWHRVICQNSNDVRHTGYSDPGRVVDFLHNRKQVSGRFVPKGHNYIISIRIHSFRIESFLAFLFSHFDVLAHPDITVETENQVNITGKGDKVGFEAADKHRRNSDQLAVSQLR